MNRSTIVAAVDIGTNTALMVVGTLHNGSVHILGDFHSTPRLGEGLFETGEISVESLNRCCQELRSFHTAASSLGVTKIVAVGTAALRMAENRLAATNQLSKALGAQIRVVDGKEEAELTLHGVLGSGLFGTILDIGGGSTELVARTSSGVNSVSFPIGAVSLTDQITKAVATGQYDTNSVSRILDPIFASTSMFPANEDLTFYAVAGTPVSLAILELALDKYDEERVDGYILSVPVVTEWTKTLRAYDAKQLASLKGVDKGRVDILPAGAEILTYVMRKLQRNSVTVSTKGLRHGILSSSLTSSFVL